MFPCGGEGRENDDNRRKTPNFMLSTHLTQRNRFWLNEMGGVVGEISMGREREKEGFMAGREVVNRYMVSRTWYAFTS